MSEVFLIRGGYEEFLKQPERIVDGFKRAGFTKNLKNDQSAGLKIHFGEKDNKSYINPLSLTSLVKFLKEKETKPFFFDTNTLYRGSRMKTGDHINLAKAHGFGKLKIPIIIGDDRGEGDDLEIEINKKHFAKCFLGACLKNIDFLLVLSHFTAHMLTGFGAAIKNLGMGCASRKGKLAQHCEVSPKIKKKKCIGCKTCLENCPVGAIEAKDEKCFIVAKKCIGCAQCISVCPQDAVKIIWSEEYEAIGEKIVEYAYAASKDKKCAYINFCIYMTKECDCMNKEERGFIQDLGVLLSCDPVAIDKASIDLILEREKRDVLKDIHPKINYLHHLKYARRLGLGSLDYNLIEL